MKSIAIFNNKGGVGKTTLLCNLAAYLALEENKKVLVVDADPQCNATQLTFDDVETEELYDDPKAFTIYNVIHPLSLGKGYTKNVEVIPRPDFGFDILIGDPRLSLKEDLLARDWSQAIGGEGRGLRTSFLFSELLTRFPEYDYVFFDVGPSLGSINRSVLLACDYFVSPMTIDIFSLKAVDNISTSIENWKKQLRTALDNLQDQDALPDNVAPNFGIQFAGYVTQQYKAKTDGSGGFVAVQAYEKIMRRVAPAIRSNFIEKLQPSKRTLDYQLGTIPNLFSLIPMAQFARRPIFALRAADGVRGAHFSKVKDAYDLFEGISAKFENNLKKLP
jgi:cellulose biosynthesis protein BcsQ